MSLSKHLLIAFLVLCAFVGRSPAQIVAFGASNVAGAGVESGQAWPAQLEALLREKGYNVNVINAGITGDTTTHMLERVDSSIPNGTKIVVLDIGGGFSTKRESISPTTRG
jgi:acyl-CoA thioesterase I